VIARFAKATGTPVPVLTGRPVTAAEWEAMSIVSGEWSLAESLMVALVERVDALRYMVQARWSRQGARVEEPLRIPRPGEPPPESDAIVMRPSEFGKMMAGM